MLIESILFTEWQCLKNKIGLYKAITILKCVMLLTLTCRNFSTYIGRHMAVTPFNFPPPAFQKAYKCQNSQEIRGQGSGSRFFKQFSSDTAGYSKSRFELNVRKMQVIKYYYRFSHFLLLRQDFNPSHALLELSLSLVGTTLSFSLSLSVSLLCILCTLRAFSRRPDYVLRLSRNLGSCCYMSVSRKYVHVSYIRLSV